MPESNPGPLPQKSGALPMSHHIYRIKKDFTLFIRGPDTVHLNSVLILPRYSNFLKALRCASHWGVRLCGVHHTAESWKQSIWKKSAESLSVVFIPPESVSCQVSVLIWNFTIAISLGRLKILLRKIILKVKNRLKGVCHKIFDLQFFSWF